jgi:opacity protein-like surface antigen
MKKIAASVGLLALGASALYAAETSTLNKMQNTKAWSVQATLRGFYDDNTSASPTAANRTESAGFSLSPSVDYGYAGEQTSFNLGYAFTARYFDKKAPGRADKSDYTHTFDADLSHVFSPRVDINASESFVIGQEPDLLRNTASTQPIDGDNIRNFASIELNLDATRLLGFSIGYNNSIYDYDDAGAVFAGTVVASPSNSGIYDRMEHALRLDSRWKIRPMTTGIVGYTFTQTAYSGDEAISGDTTIAAGTPGGVVLSDFRDSRGHRLYVGLDQIFNNTLSASARIGAEFADYINDPAGETDASPYAMLALTYQYQTTTAVSAGATYSRTAASGSVFGGGAGFIRDMESISIYGSVKHELAAKLFLSGTASAFQSTYNAPGSPLIDGQSYIAYALGLDLSYQFNPNLSGHVGYNYDHLTDDPLLRDYDRNRVYLGVTAGF